MARALMPLTVMSVLAAGVTVVKAVQRSGLYLS